VSFSQDQNNPTQAKTWLEWATYPTLTDQKFGLFETKEKLRLPHPLLMPGLYSFET